MIAIRQTEAFQDWMRSLGDANARSRINARIVRLAGGLFGDVKPVGDGVSELQIDVGPGYRIYFAQRGRVLVILLCGGDKSSQRRDIARAKAQALLLED
jgi:putative addiction module killer protein